VADLLAEIGKNLADRWLTLLVLPGALFLAVLATARTLGQAHAFDVQRLVHQVSAWAALSTVHSTAALAVILVAVLLGSAAAGVAAQAVGSMIENIWLAAGWRTWPAPLRQIAGRRLRRRQLRWREAQASYQNKRDEAGRALALSRIRSRTPAQQVPLDDLAAAYECLARISREYPGRPMWIGDRIEAVTVRLNREYRLDLATVWPSLWLAMPQDTRADITTSRQSLTTATALAGWGILYLVPGVLWWPALVVAAGTVFAGYRRARIAADAYALILDAAARLHSCDLARQLGIEHTGPLDQDTGWALTRQLQGQPESRIV